MAPHRWVRGTKRSSPLEVWREREAGNPSQSVRVSPGSRAHHRTLRQGSAETSNLLYAVRQGSAETPNLVCAVRQGSAETPNLVCAVRQGSAETSNHPHAVRRLSAETTNLLYAVRQLSEEKTNLPHALRQLSGEFEKATKCVGSLLLFPVERNKL